MNIYELHYYVKKFGGKLCHTEVVANNEKEARLNACKRLKIKQKLIIKIERVENQK